MRRESTMLPFVLFSALSLGAQGLVFVFNIIVANKLSMVDYANYSIVLSVINLLLLLCSQWLNPMMQYCGSNEFAETGKASETNQVRNLLFSFCFITISVVVIFFRQRIEEYVGGKFVYLILALVLFKALQENLTSYLIAIGKRQITAVNLFLIQTVATIALFAIETKISTVLWIQILSNILIVQLIRHIDLQDYAPHKVNKDTVRKCTSFALWQLVGSIAIYIISYGDNYIIKSFLQTEDIAIYNAAYRIFNAVYIASNTIATFYISPLAKALNSNKPSDIKKIFFEDRLVIFALCAVMHLVLLVIAPWLFEILYQGKYNDSVPIFRVLLFSSMIRYWTVFEMMYFNSTGKIRIQQTLNIVSATLKVLLSIAFIFWFGLMGVAYSTFISTAVVGIISFWMSEKKMWLLGK